MVTGEQRRKEVESGQLAQGATKAEALWWEHPRNQQGVVGQA